MVKNLNSKSVFLKKLEWNLSILKKATHSHKQTHTHTPLFGKWAHSGTNYVNTTFLLSTTNQTVWQLHNLDTISPICHVKNWKLKDTPWHYSINFSSNEKTKSCCPLRACWWHWRMICVNFDHVVTSRFDLLYILIGKVNFVLVCAESDNAAVAGWLSTTCHTLFRGVARQSSLDCFNCWLDDQACSLML